MTGAKYNYPGNIACPSCGGTDTAVRDSRGTTEGWIRRRRLCNGCGERMTTYEVREEDLEGTLRQITAIRAAAVALRKLIGALPTPVRLPAVETLNVEQMVIGGADMP